MVEVHFSICIFELLLTEINSQLGQRAYNPSLINPMRLVFRKSFNEKKDTPNYPKSLIDIL